MSEPDCKRLKMNEPGGSKTKQVQLFYPEACTFERLVKMEAFVDHSNIIKKIVEEPTYKFVVAPSRFCKSTNMEMVRSFFEIEVDGKGDAIRNVMREATSIEELRGTNLKNYDLFCVPEPKCKILEDEEFVLKHFGRYPVIKLDFAVCGITCYDDALSHCLSVIHKAYLKHAYLVNSGRLNIIEPNLNKDAQDICEKWYRIEDLIEGDDKMLKYEIQTGLANLSMFLHSHFGRKVILLVDEFDAIMSQAKFRVEADQELTEISNLVIDVISNILKGTEAGNFVECVLLTGIETISGMGYSPRLTGVQKYMFLDSKEFFGFYGVEENDLRELVTKLKLKGLLQQFKDKEVQQIMDGIMENYNGYYCEGCQDTSVLSLWNVLHYLQDGKPDIHWTRPQLITCIEGFLKQPAIAAQILKLTGKKAGEETVIVKICKTVDIQKLRELIGKKLSPEGPGIDLAFTYLMELGYLSNVKGSDLKGDRRELKLANEEIRREFLQTLRENTEAVVGFDSTIMVQAADMVNIFRCEDASEEFKKYLKEWYDILEKFLAGFKTFRDLDINESVVMSVLTVALSMTYDFERIASNYPIKDEKGNNLTTSRTDLWIQYRDPDPKNIYDIITEIKYNTLAYTSQGQELKHTSLYGLREILDKEGGKKGYISGIQSKRYLLMGISMDKNLLLSISCLLNTTDDKKAVCLSKTEFTKFPAYYDGCVDLLKE